MPDQTADGPIETLRGMLTPDGYDLVVTERRGDEVDLSIIAGPDACADCLVPKVIFSEIIANYLTPAGLKLGELAYPVDVASH